MLGISNIEGRLDRVENDMRQLVGKLDELQKTLEETNKILADLLQVQLIAAGQIDTSEEV